MKKTASIKETNHKVNEASKTTVQNDFNRLLLNGPVMNSKQYKAFKTKREMYYL